MTVKELSIEKPAYGGCGLGFIDGKAVFIPYAVPGDRIIAEITVEKKDYAFGSIREMVMPSPDRVLPECPNFTVCGGCDYLCVEYAAELRIKIQILTDSLRRIAKLDEHEIPVIDTAASNRFRYRTHATLKTGPGGIAGFYGRDTNTVIGLPKKGCLLLAEELTESLRRPAPPGPEEFRIAVDKDGNVVTGVMKDAVIRETENGIVYERDPERFFQSNRFLRSRMLSIAGGYAALTSGETFLDIGCGVGFFTLFLAAGGSRGTGVDIDRESIAWAVHNARLNGIASAEFFPADTATLDPSAYRDRVLILDPPRAGISSKARAVLRAMDPPRMVYVSCNPSTFARDMRDFSTRGYRLDRLTMIDMFPATGHIEVIGLLVKK